MNYNGEQGKKSADVKDNTHTSWKKRVRLSVVPGYDVLFNSLNSSLQGAGGLTISTRFLYDP